MWLASLVFCPDPAVLLLLFLPFNMSIMTPPWRVCVSRSVAAIHQRRVSSPSNYSSPSHLEMWADKFFGPLIPEKTPVSHADAGPPVQVGLYCCNSMGNTSSEPQSKKRRAVERVMLCTQSLLHNH